MIEKVVEVAKGLFGFQDKSHTKRLEAEWLKFLYYGEVKGFLTNTRLDALRNHIYYTDSDMHVSIRQLFEEIARQHQSPSLDRPARMRAILIDYHSEQSAYLQPHFWSRLLQKPDLDRRQLVHFGDTSLLLAQKALNAPQPDIQMSLKFLLEAYHLKNTDPAFQRKLALQFKQLVETYGTEAAISTQRPLIQQTWIDLAKTAYNNRCPAEAREYIAYAMEPQPAEEIKNQAAELYLANRDYERLEPFLPILQRLKAHLASFQIQIGQAYWHYRRYPEGIAAYQRAIQLLAGQQPLHSSMPHQELAYLHAEIGKAYFQQLEGLNHEERLRKAIDHLQKACLYSDNKTGHQNMLHEAYFLQWQGAQEEFLTSHGSDWLQFLTSRPIHFLKEECKKITDILIACSDKAFESHHNQEAHQFLQKGIELFNEDPSFVLSALKVSLKYADLTSIKDRLSDWKQRYYSHPFIQEKIGDAYWSSQDKGKALAVYQDALVLFERKRERSQQQEEKLACDLHSSSIHAKIAQDKLQTQPGYLTGIPYDEAIGCLEKAAKLNPNAYNKPLFEAYLTAGQAEIGKSYLNLSRNIKKTMLYYSKAFALEPQNGPYLTTLMQLYLSHALYPEALELFSSIQKEPWAQEFALPAKQLSLLAQQLFEKNSYQFALHCLERAHLLEPNNVAYKQDFYQLFHTLCADEQKKLAQAEDSEEKVHRLLALAERLKLQAGKGFNKIEKFEKEYKAALSSTYRTLAETYVNRFRLDEPEPIGNTREHRKTFIKEIEQAIHYYEKALLYAPEDASLHFEKGMVLDFNIEIKEALESYRQAVRFKSKNPFYRKRLAFIYGVLASMNKMKEHEEKMNTSSTFDTTYRLWFEEYFVKNKTQQVNPHTYT